MPTDAKKVLDHYRQARFKTVSLEILDALASAIERIEQSQERSYVKKWFGEKQ